MEDLHDRGESFRVNRESLSRYTGRSTSRTTGGMLEANGGIVKEMNHDSKG